MRHRPPYYKIKNILTHQQSQQMDTTAAVPEVMDIELPITTSKKTKKSSKKGSADAHKTKKVKKSKSKAEEPVTKKSKKKKSVEVPVVVAVTKKRKADDSDSVAKAQELNVPKKMAEWLELLRIRCDEKQLKMLELHCPAMYHELFKIASHESAKGFFFGFIAKSPIGRMFWYSAEEKVFKSVHSHANVIQLVKHPKEASLNLASLKEQLTADQRKAVYECLGVAEADADSIISDRWLFALIETGVIEKVAGKPDYKQAAESCLLYDAALKTASWLPSKTGKLALKHIVVSRERAVTEKNIDAEFQRLLKKRAEIAAHLKKALTTSAEMAASLPPILPLLAKKKKHEEVEIKKTKKIKKKAPVVAVEEAKVESVASSQSFSLSSSEEEDDASQSSEEQPMSKDKAQLLEIINREKIIDPSLPVTAKTTSVATSLEVSRSIEHCRKRQKLLHDDLEPEIKWFRTECT